MNVLVMGGTQFNGLALVHNLVAKGHKVTVCNRGRTESDIPESVGRLIADRTDTAALAAALKGREWDCVHDMTAYHPEDVQVMVELLDGLVGHYVFASSTVTYQSKDSAITELDPDDRGDGQIEYGLHKLLCEDILFAAHAEKGFPATSVPFSMVVGPHNAMTDREQRMFARVRDGRPVLIPGDGETLLQLGDVGDQADALTQMMGAEVTFGRRYNLTGAQPLSRREYVAIIADVIGREAQVQEVPAETMEDLWTGERSLDFAAPSGALNIRSSGSAKKAAIAGPRALLRTRFMLCLNLVQQLAPNLHWWDQDTTFSIDRLRDDVGWVPSHTAASMLERTYQWWSDSGRADHQYDWTAEDQLVALLSA